MNVVSWGDRDTDGQNEFDIFWRETSGLFDGALIDKHELMTTEQIKDGRKITIRTHV